jgi:hypothetical protein
MKMSVARLCFVILFIAGCILGCKESEEKKYIRYEREQLAAGIRHDSLFFGLYLGMPHKEFRTYCFDMNLKGKFKQGGKKSQFWVQAKVDEMQYPAEINFYPNFTNEKISEMNAAVYYDNPVFKDGIFNKDSLLHDVLGLLDKWYGGETFKIKSPVFYKEDLYVKVSGNRRITISMDQTGQMINLWYTDLTVLKK